ncbi:MAG TPA: N-carbamoylsarcosine amidohydrolase [Vicinamibacteria bacterium]|nr:N-carbamoylsarcosine amidohydrolase [Vicinamibacteria bacterium]HRB13393.1 N-carbamoylsarcosine amidohydrolase [Vicinamibacteria bacterium]
MAPSRKTEPVSTLELYRSRGLGSRVGFGSRPAVVVVDYIVGFTDPKSPLAGDFANELRATRSLLNAMRRRGAPVFFTTTAYDKAMTEAGVFVRKVPSLAVLQRGSRWVEIDPSLKRRRNEVVIEKQYASAFFGTPLASTLHAQGVDTLIVAGCTTSGCVRATAVDGLQHGLRVIVPRECVGDRAAGPHEANLVDIDGKYGDVMAVKDVIALVERAGR